jgi:hypothetical protein
MKIRSLAVLYFIVGCGKSSKAPKPLETPKAPAEWTVEPARYGSLAFPTTFADAQSLFGETFTMANNADAANCGYIRPRQLPAGVSLMTKRDTIVRIDVDSAGVRTAAGIQIGATEAQVLDTYSGHTKVTPGKYDGPEGHDITVMLPGDSTHALIFQTRGGRVWAFHAGRRPEVELVERCS